MKVRFYIALPLLLLFQLKGFADSHCNGKSETACNKATDCTWVHSYKRGDTKVEGYCRTLPSQTDKKSATHKSKADKPNKDKKSTKKTKSEHKVDKSNKKAKSTNKEGKKDKLIKPSTSKKPNHNNLHKQTKKSEKN